jgi:hypothetical protein
MSPTQQIDRPRDVCKLYAERLVSTETTSLAGEVKELAAAVSALAKVTNEVRHIVMGANLDNGMVTRLRDCERDLQALKKLPCEVKGMVVKWGFALIGVQFAVNAGFLGLLLHLVQNMLVKGP